MMTADQKEQLIMSYVKAYNAKNVAAMLTSLAEHMVFENSSNGEVTMRLEGLDAFRRQAEQATALFSEREQRITSFTHNGNQTEIGITYRAIFAMDLPNGFKKGDELQLEGKSVFMFSDTQIIGISDIS